MPSTVPGANGLVLERAGSILPRLNFILFLFPMLYAHRSASFLLLLTTIATLLTSCGKEEATPEVKAETTLSRSLAYDPATTTKPAAVISYSGGQTKASARILTVPIVAFTPMTFLQLGFRGDAAEAADSLMIRVPVTQLKPGWVGTYTSVSYPLAGGGGSAEYYFFSKRNGLKGDGYGVGPIGLVTASGLGSYTITITAYDAATQRVSGTYSLAESRVPDFTDYDNMFGYNRLNVWGKITLQGSFSHLPVAP
jgi:hypothetical protein